jgi:hypothetical protein
MPKSSFDLAIDPGRPAKTAEQNGEIVRISPIGNGV